MLDAKGAQRAVRGAPAALPPVAVGPSNDGAEEFEERLAVNPPSAGLPASAPDVLTPEDLAVWLRMSPKWVEKATQARRLPGQFKVGRLWRYRRTAIELNILRTGRVLLEKQKGRG